MNERPVSYLQTDPRWAALPYAAAGETATIGASGCGPTAMAMVLATWADPGVTPETECAWALAHGYKARGQGTYYSYFVPAAGRYGLTCARLNGVSLYGDGASGLHDQVLRFLARGDLVIACMGPGTWTRGGHFVLLWDVGDGVAYVNDPASLRPPRTRGDWGTFRRQVKYYWVLENPGREGEEKDMTEEQTRALIREELERALATAAEPVYHTLDQVPAWGRAAVERRLAAGALTGTGEGLDVTQTMVRLWTVEDRMGEGRENRAEP